MDKYLESQLFVYRRSYKFYFRIGVLMSLFKSLFNVLSLSGYYFFPLTLFTLISGCLEILEKSLKISERVEEYKHAYKFYRQFLHFYKANTLSEGEISLREQELSKNCNFFPREKYLKQVNLNGYAVMDI